MTNELFPLAPGGIGRLVHNFIEDNENSAEPVEFHVLFVGAEEASDLAAEYFRGKATLHSLSNVRIRRLLETLCTDAPSRDGEFARYHESLAIYLWLERREREGTIFDTVEFPDIHAWGLHAISAKRAGLALSETQIAVRLHSSNGVISYFEPHYHHPSQQWLYTFDAERFCIEHADVVVGHLEAIRDFNAEFYGVGATWQERTRIERPPISLTAQEKLPTINPGELPPEVDAALATKLPLFVFSQRLQPFKRADLFLDGAIAACRMEDQGDPTNAVYLILSYGWDGAYIDALKARVPTDLRSRILFWETAGPNARTYVLERSTVVFPSSYESLCLAVIECAQKGRPVILNRECVGFAGNRWLQEYDAEYFDGTAMDLARVMVRLARHGAKNHPAATWEHDRPYWEADAAPTRSVSAQSMAALRVVLWAGEYPAVDRRAIESVLASKVDVDIHVLQTSATYVLTGWLNQMDGDKVASIVPASGITDAELLRHCLATDSEFAMLVPSGYVANPRFVEAAMDAIRCDPSVKLVSGPVLRLPTLPESRSRIQGELIPRAACSLAGTMGPLEPLAATVFRVGPVLQALGRSYGSRGALRDAHAALVPEPGLALEMPLISATLISSHRPTADIGPLFRAGVLRAYGTTETYGAALIP